MSKTLQEVIEAVKDNETVDLEDLFYAVVALDALWHFDRGDLWEALDDQKHATLKCTIDESFRRFKTAMGKPPKEWVGESFDPRHPEYQDFRRMAFKIARDAGVLPKETP